MLVFFDANILPDVLLTRAGLEVESRELWNAVEGEKLEGCVSPVSITTVHYLAYKTSRDLVFAMDGVKRITNVFEIATVDSDIIHEAARSGMRDFEDAVQSYAARSASAACIVTRNVKDFIVGPVESIFPGDLIDILRVNGLL